MLSDTEKADVLVRLKKIEGQVRGLGRMVEADTYCVEVMNQVAAAQGALARISRKLLSQHLKTCVRDAVSSGNAGRQEAVLDEIENLFARYGRIESTRKK